MKKTFSITDFLVKFLKLIFYPFGRMGRIDFLIGCAVALIIYRFGVIYTLDLHYSLVGVNLKSQTFESFTYSLGHGILGVRVALVFSILLMWVVICIVFKRLRDLESGGGMKTFLVFLALNFGFFLLIPQMQQHTWLRALTLIPFISMFVLSIMIITCVALPGTPGPNKYGPPERYLVPKF